MPQTTPSWSKGAFNKSAKVTFVADLSRLNMGAFVALLLLAATTSCSSSSGGETTASTKASTSPASESAGKDTSTDASLMTDTAVKQAALEVDAAIMECARAIPECDTSTLNAVLTGPSLEQSTKLYDSLNVANYQLENTDKRKLVVKQVETTPPSATDPATANTVECEHDESVLYLERNGEESIIEDAPTNLELNKTYVIEDGRWKMYEVEVVKDLGPDGTCE